LNRLDFGALGIGPSLCRALSELGFEHPTDLQQQAIPEALEGTDVLGLAQTGTGKTAAFSLPILEQLMADRVRARSRHPSVLILAPTRELAAQIQSDIADYARYTKIRHTCIFGGVSAQKQIRALADGVEVLVATPGRLLDLAGSRDVNLSEVTHLVLDEADRLLDMGFIRDVNRIVAMLPEDRQSMLFSATMPKEVAALAARILTDPVRVDVSPETMTVEKIEQAVVHVENDRKQDVLQTLLHEPEVTRAIVFTRTKHGANRVATKLDKAGIAAEAIHGNKSQNARQRALENFKSGESWVLVATDIAARGIDIEGISHVINFELPHEPESYVHRIGRTARAGASGVAWSLVDPSEIKRLKAIERLTRVRPAQLQVRVSDQPAAERERPSRSSSEAPRHGMPREGIRSEASGAGQQERSGRNRRRRRSRRPRARAA